MKFNLQKAKWTWNDRKMTNHLPSPGYMEQTTHYIVKVT